MTILNIKTIATLDDMRVAYCGNNYEYWATRYPVIKEMDDFSILGKPRNLIVRGDRTTTCNNYEEYLKLKISCPIDGQDIQQKIIELSTYDAVACWCEPEECHTERIIKLMETLCQ